MQMIMTRLLSTLLLSAASVAFSFDARAGMQQIEQLVIVYSPQRDHNGFFQSLDESLGQLMAGARKRGLRVVLLNTDDFEGPSGDNELLRTLEHNVKARKSFVMVATHGSALRNADGTFDTALSFPGGMTFSKLTNVIGDDPNLTGIMLRACSSDNVRLPEIGRRATACGVSQAGESVGFATASAYSNTLAAAVELGTISDLPGHLRSGVASQIMRENEETRKKLLGPHLDYTKIPIYGPKNFGVEFKGKKFEIVDGKGQAMKPCVAPDDPTRIVSLPAKIFPDEARERLLKQGSPRDFSSYFESRVVRRGPKSFTFECSSEGRLLVRGPTTCDGPSIAWGDGCKNDLERLLPAARKKMYAAPTALAVEYCKERAADRAWLESQGVLIEAKKICVENGCLFGSDKSIYGRGLGECGLNGGVCLPMPKGDVMLGSKVCQEHIKYPPADDGLGFYNPCTDALGARAAVGACFTPLEGKLPPYKADDRRLSWQSAQEFSTVAARAVPGAYRCVARGTRVDSEVDEQCCVAGGGAYVKAKKITPFSVERLETITDKDEQRMAFTELALGMDHCDRKALPQQKLEAEAVVPVVSDPKNSPHSGAY